MTTQKFATIEKCRKEDFDPDRPRNEQIWCLYTKDGSDLLGRHSTHDEAEAQERAIHSKKGSTMKYLKLAQVPEASLKELYNPKWAEGIMKAIGADIDSQLAQKLFYTVWNTIIQLMDRVLQKQYKVDTHKLAGDPTFMQSLAGLAYFVTDDALKSSLGVKSDSLQKAAGHLEALMQTLGLEADVEKTLQGLKNQAKPVAEKAFDRITNMLKTEPANDSDGAEQKAASPKERLAALAKSWKKQADYTDENRRDVSIKIRPLILEGLKKYQDWFATEAGQHYSRDFENFVNNWIWEIADVVMWAEESGTGDISSLDAQGYIGELAEILFKLSPNWEEPGEQKRIANELHDLEDSVLESAFEAAARSLRKIAGTEHVATEIEGAKWFGKNREGEMLHLLESWGADRKTGKVYWHKGRQKYLVIPGNPDEYEIAAWLVDDDESKTRPEMKNLEIVNLSTLLDMADQYEIDKAMLDNVYKERERRRKYERPASSTEDSSMKLSHFKQAMGAWQKAVDYLRYLLSQGTDYNEAVFEAAEQLSDDTGMDIEEAYDELERQHTHFMPSRMRELPEFASLDREAAEDENPWVGWKDLPRGWTKESAKSFWNSVGGSVDKCIAKLSKAKGIKDPAAMCASMKDLMAGYEEWRKGRGKKSSSDHEAAEGENPWVGLHNLPRGWTRESVESFWNSVGGNVDKCIAKLSKAKGIEDSAGLCAAIKDELSGTEMWRGKGKKSSTDDTLIYMGHVYRRIEDIDR